MIRDSLTSTDRPPLARSACGGARARALGLTIAAVTMLCITAAGSAHAEPLEHSAPAGRVLVASCGNEQYGGEVRPREWSSGCTGGSMLIRRLVWRQYGASSARARGTALLNDCDPICADATIRRYPAQLLMSRVRLCSLDEGAYPFFTRATVIVRYPPGNPFGKKAGWRPAGTYRATADC